MLILSNHIYVYKSSIRMALKNRFLSGFLVFLFLYFLEHFVLSGETVELPKLKLTLYLFLVLACEDNEAGGALHLYKIRLCHIENTLPRTCLHGNWRFYAGFTDGLLYVKGRFPILDSHRD